MVRGPEITGAARGDRSPARPATVVSGAARTGQERPTPRCAVIMEPVCSKIIFSPVRRPDLHERKTVNTP